MIRFLPWKLIAKRAARAYGLVDPAIWLSRIRSFAQPSEIGEPIELLRAGVLFHARGIVNTRAIQHNLDWIWPYWVVRQFDPTDVSFIPRAFSFSHVNLTHRNWTAVGLPGLSIYPIVDPRGLVTPLTDGWSIDCWILDDTGNLLIPSRLADSAVEQSLVMDDGLAVTTCTRHGNLTLRNEARVVLEENQPVLALDLRATTAGAATLVVAIRPYNPEGVQFIDSIEVNERGDGWRVNEGTDVQLGRPADQFVVSDYADGDVYSLLRGRSGRHSVDHEQTRIECKVGMATAAAVFSMNREMSLRIRVPLQDELQTNGNPARFRPQLTWPAVRERVAKLGIPDARKQFLYDAAVQTLILLSADEVVPGPYTYRRFWFRDACVMMNSLLSIGLVEQCRQTMQGFISRQLRDGYFRSQEGEWDSNGQVLWIYNRYEKLTGEKLPANLIATIPKAIEWIERKRVWDESDPLHIGLLPAGFSAEHLGPNDHYYWDDFWAEAGLRGAAELLERHGRTRDAADALRKADDLRSAIDRSIQRTPAWRSRGGVPASPHRRIDAGAVGSMVADYPLQLFPPGSPAMMATADQLLERCFLHGGFFQDVIHSGVNAYLTLDIAQTLLRAGDLRYLALVDAVAKLASPTGQWPEAIHPQTGGGCMGDGQHGWAAAEWVMMLRNMFIREERDRLIIGSGILPGWFDSEHDLTFGPTVTPWGTVTVKIVDPRKQPALVIQAEWYEQQPLVEVAIRGFRTIQRPDICNPIVLQREIESPAPLNQVPDTPASFFADLSEEG
jgi:hypothetical protein